MEGKTWKNKRRKSLYNRENNCGFIYRKPMVTRNRAKEMKQAEKSQESELRQHHVKKQKLNEDDKGKEEKSLVAVEKERSTVMDTSDHIYSSSVVDKEGSAVMDTSDHTHQDSSDNTSLDTAVFPIGKVIDEETKMKIYFDLFCDSFVQDLKKEILKDSDSSQTELETILTEVNESLKSTGLFKQALQEPQEIPHPLEEKTQQKIKFIEGKLKRLDLELQDWTELFDLSHEEPKSLSIGIAQSTNEELSDSVFKENLTEDQLAILKETTNVVNDISGVEIQLKQMEQLLESEQAHLQEETSVTIERLNEEKEKYKNILKPFETPRTLLGELRH